MSVPFQYGVAYSVDSGGYTYYGIYQNITNSPTTTIKASVVFDGEPIIMYGYFESDKIFHVTSDNFVLGIPFSITFYPILSPSLTWFFSP